MAKLYWRLKVNGKWSWRPAVLEDVITHVDSFGNQRKEYVVQELEQ